VSEKKLKRDAPAATVVFFDVNGKSHKDVLACTGNADYLRARSRMMRIG
jgi:hypothetical protein